MGFGAIVLLLYLVQFAVANVFELYFQENKDLAKVIVEALQDTRFQEEILFDLKAENQQYVNRTTSLIIKYIVKREVDNYRTKRTEAIRRRIYSNLVMKLIDIAKDLSRNESTSTRIDKAHKYYSTVQNNEVHDTMADIQVFHYVARLYDIMIKAPKILNALGSPDDLTPKLLVKKLKGLQVHPVHLGTIILIQYYLRNAINFAIESKVIQVLSIKPHAIGTQVIDMLKALAARLLPITELLDIHLAHGSNLFKDTCPATWLGIVNTK